MSDGLLGLHIPNLRWSAAGLKEPYFTCAPGVYSCQAYVGRHGRTEAGIMKSPLEREFQYYLDNQEELVRKHGGKVIAIKGCEVIGVYDSESEALERTSGEHPLGTFLVQRCEPGRESVTQTFHSRAVFV